MKVQGLDIPPTLFAEGQKVRIVIPPLFLTVEELGKIANSEAVVIGSRLKLAEFDAHDVANLPMETWKPRPHLQRCYYLILATGHETAAPICETWLRPISTARAAARQAVNQREAAHV